ncbi:MAG: FhaA domain-containing protein [Anaerolineae bacterium]
MNALERFEDWLHHVMEGSLAGLLGAEIQPVDLAKRLADHMEDNRTIGAGRVYVPNNYRVYLAPRTLSGFAAFKSALQDELTGFLTARADEKGYQFLGRVAVQVLADSGLPRERMRVESDVVDRLDDLVDDSASQTRAIPIAHVDVPEPEVPVVIVVGQRRVVIQGPGPLTVGRALDNDVIIDDRTVSRHHARLVPRGTHWMYEDLGSTHGSYVNGHRITASLLRPGDQLRLGSLVARLEPVGGDRTAEE